MSAKIRNERGQSFVEIGLLMSTILLLVLGAIEVVNLVDTAYVLNHLTREGSNMTSRGTPVNQAIEAVVASSRPVVKGTFVAGTFVTGSGNSAKWRIVHSRVGSPADPVNPNNCDGDPASYVILEQTALGGLAAVSEVGPSGVCSTANLPDLDVIAGGLEFSVMEVFLDYTPITPLGNFGVDFVDHRFYKRAAF